MQRGGQKNMCAFYFLFVKNFKCKKNLVDINIIFYFLYIWLFFLLQKWAKIRDSPGKGDRPFLIYAFDERGSTFCI